MVNVSGPLKIMTDKASRVSEVWVGSPQTRPHGGGLLVEERDKVTPVGGVLSFTSVPGPVLLTLVSGGRVVDSVKGIVPDKESATLAEVVSAGNDWTPHELSMFQKLAEQAQQATAVTGADRVKTGSDRAVVEAERATVEAERAHVDAQAAAIDTAFTESVPPYLQPDAPGGLRSTYLHRGKSPLMLLDYAVGDGVTDDTTGVQIAFNEAITQERALYSPPGANYLVGPLNISGMLMLEGYFEFTAIAAGQDYMIRQTAQVDWSHARVRLNALRRSRYGLVASNASRSKYGHLSVLRCTVWGLKLLEAGNNNHCHVDSILAYLNGEAATIRVTQTERTANWSNSLAGYGVGSISGSLPANALLDRAVYFVLVAKNLSTNQYWDLAGDVDTWSGLPTNAEVGSYWYVRSFGKVYQRGDNGWPPQSGGVPTEVVALRLKSLTDTTVQANNMGGEIGQSFTMWVPIGGGIDWEKSGDNGVWTILSADIRSNIGTGIHHAGLYGHTMPNAVFQSNMLGFTCSDFTMQMTFDKPYFETNWIDYVSHMYVRGVMQEPLMDVSKIQNISSRIEGKGNVDSKLVILNADAGGLKTADVAVNPGSRLLAPGRMYAYRFAGNDNTRSFRIDTLPGGGALSEHTILLHIDQPDSARNYINFSVTSGSGDTIGGGGSQVVTIHGPTFITLTRIAGEWKSVVLSRSVPATSISSAPKYAGQTAVVSGVAYIAVGTSSTADWKQITPDV